MILNGVALTRRLNIFDSFTLPITYRFDLYRHIDIFLVYVPIGMIFNDVYNQPQPCLPIVLGSMQVSPAAERGLRVGRLIWT